jgi:hypothetical protein
MDLPLGTYYGDIQFDWDEGGDPRSPWTPNDIVLAVARDYAG